MAERPAPPGTISKTTLCELAEITDRRLRQLADEGYFPPPVRGFYQLTPAIKGLFRYYREQLHKKEDSVAAGRKRNLHLKNEKLEEELQVMRKEYVRLADIAPALRGLSSQQRAILQRKLETELGPKLANLAYEKIRPQLAAAVDEICAIMRDGVAAWMGEDESSKPKVQSSKSDAKDPA